MDSTIQNVAVLSSSSTDFKLIQRLLEDVNHRINIVSINGNRNNSIELKDVAIVCHRRTLQTPAPSLPKGRIPSLLIVLSDCLQEKPTVDSLEAGAHHYFNIDESPRVLSVRLIAAMRSKLRTRANSLEVLPYKFYIESRKVTLNDKPVHLSPREFSLAYFLFSNHSRIVFDSELMVTIWTLPSTMDSRRIDTAVCRIRKKLNLYDDESGWILHRLRLVGYRLLSADKSINNETNKNAKTNANANANANVTLSPSSLTATPL